MNGLASLYAPQNEPTPAPGLPLGRPAPVGGPAVVQFGQQTPGAAPPALAGDPGGTMGGLASMYLGQQQAEMAQRTAAADQARSRAVSLFGVPLA